MHGLNCNMHEVTSTRHESEVMISGKIICYLSQVLQPIKKFTRNTISQGTN